MGKSRPDAALEARLSVIENDVALSARPAFVHQLHPVTRNADGSLSIGPLTVQSRRLAETLDGCDCAFLFAATLGTGVDALLRRYGATSAADLLIAQAAATALIENVCDDCEAEMRRNPSIAGKKLRARFSPGYGDLPLAAQRPLLAILDATRRIGISLTSADQMVPSKSVTAIVGIASERPLNS